MASGYLRKNPGFSLQMESIPGHWPFSRDLVTTKRTKKARENSPDGTKGAVIEITSIWILESAVYSDIKNSTQRKV